jgi:hypothetical protein
MKKQVILISSILGLMWLAATPAVFAQKRVPADIAQRCIDRINVVAQRGCERIDVQVGEAVPHILELLAEGKIRRAMAVVDRKIARVHRINQRIEDAITRVRDRCAGRLLGMGEVDLANAVRSASVDAIATVNACRDDAVDTLEATLGGDVE